ncbi:TPA: hypothetical protein ACYLN4_000564 [Burkholderia lata]
MLTKNQNSPTPPAPQLWQIPMLRSRRNMFAVALLIVLVLAGYQEVQVLFLMDQTKAVSDLLNVAGLILGFVGATALASVILVLTLRIERIRGAQS